MYQPNLQNQQLKFEELPEDSFDWGIVNKYDPKFINLTNDTQAMNTILNAFLRCSLGYNDFKVVQNTTVFKLLQLLQIILDYLMRTQTELENSNSKLINKYTHIQTDLSRAKCGLRKSINQCNKLKNSEKCPTCKKVFDSSLSLDKHMHSKHSELASVWEGLRQGKILDSLKAAESMQKQIDELRALVKNQSQELSERILLQQKEVIINELKKQEEIKKNQEYKPPFRTEVPNKKNMSKNTNDAADNVKTNRTAQVETNDSNEIHIKKRSDSDIEIIDIAPKDSRIANGEKSSNRKPKNVVPLPLGTTVVYPPNYKKKKFGLGTVGLAKKFLDRHHPLYRQDSTFEKAKILIQERIHEQSLEVRLRTSRLERELVKDTIQKSLDISLPEPKKAIKNNLTELRRKPEPYELKERVGFETNVDNAEYVKKISIPESTTITTKFEPHVLSSNGSPKTKISDPKFTTEESNEKGPELDATKNSLNKSDMNGDKKDNNIRDGAVKDDKAAIEERDKEGKVLSPTKIETEDKGKTPETSHPQLSNNIETDETKKSANAEKDSIANDGKKVEQMEGTNKVDDKGNAEKGSTGAKENEETNKESQGGQGVIKEQKVTFFSKLKGIFKKKLENLKLEIQKPGEQKLQSQVNENQKLEVQKPEEQKLESQVKENQTLENREAENQKPEEQKQENQTLEAQKQENQKSEGQKPENQMLESQKQENQNLEGQKQENQKLGGQEGEGNKAEIQKSDKSKEVSTDKKGNEEKKKEPEPEYEYYYYSEEEPNNKVNGQLVKSNPQNQKTNNEHNKSNQQVNKAVNNIINQSTVNNQSKDTQKSLVAKDVKQSVPIKDGNNQGANANAEKRTSPNDGNNQSSKNANPTQNVKVSNEKKHNDEISFASSSHTKHENNKMEFESASVTSKKSQKKAGVDFIEFETESLN